VQVEREVSVVSLRREKAGVTVKENAQDLEDFNTWRVIEGWVQVGRSKRIFEGSKLI
jgi:hypothetical protein